MTFDTILVAYNPSAGFQKNNSLILETLKQKLSLLSTSVHIFHVGNIFKFIDEASKLYINKNSLVMVVGGDGTLHTIVNALYHTQAVFGVVPAGTMNHFAKSLGLPGDYMDCIHQMPSYRSTLHDLGICENEIFLNHANIGLHPRFIYYRDEKRKQGWNKWIASAYSLIKVTSQPSLQKIYISIKGSNKELLCRTPFVFISNNAPYMERGVPIKTQYSNGYLVIHTKSESHFPRLDLVRSYIYMASTSYDLPDDVDVYTVKEEVTIGRKNGKPLIVALDGELRVMPNPCTFHLLPAAFRVLSP